VSKLASVRFQAATLPRREVFGKGRHYEFFLFVLAAAGDTTEPSGSLCVKPMAHPKRKLDEVCDFGS
jgi:hypothetical protein